jgi:hypothetical protein
MKMVTGSEDAHVFHVSIFAGFEHLRVAGMAGRYTGSYLDRFNGWRAVATLAETGRASLVERIPISLTTFASTGTIKLLCPL